MTVVPSGEVSVKGPPIVTGELAARTSGWLNTNAVATAMPKGIARPMSENMGRRRIKCLPPAAVLSRHKLPSRFSGYFLDDFCP